MIRDIHTCAAAGTNRAATQATVTVRGFGGVCMDDQSWPFKGQCGRVICPSDPGNLRVGCFKKIHVLQIP